MLCDARGEVPSWGDMNRQRLPAEAREPRIAQTNWKFQIEARVGYVMAEAMTHKDYGDGLTSE